MMNKSLKESLSYIQSFIDKKIPKKNNINEVSNDFVNNIINRYENKLHSFGERNVQLKNIKNALYKRSKLSIDLNPEDNNRNLSKISVVLYNYDPVHRYFRMALEGYHYENYCEIFDLDEDEVIEMFESFTSKVVNDAKSKTQDDLREELFKKGSVLHNATLISFDEEGEICQGYSQKNIRDLLVYLFTDENPDMYINNKNKIDEKLYLIFELIFNDHIITFKNPRDARKFVKLINTMIKHLTGYEFTPNYHDFLM